VIAAPGSVVLLPPEVATIGAVREHMRLAELQREHPEHELFVLAFKKIPDNPFAVVVRIRKDVLHIQDRDSFARFALDFETRVTVIHAAGKLPIDEGRAE
jgi:hypothetical protein